MSDNSLNDALLIERAQGGDRASFDLLVSKYSGRAFQYAYRLSHSQDDAADIVSEAFVRVFNAIGNFKGQSAFSTWMYRILTNCFLDARKKDKSKYNVSLESSLKTEEGDLERQIESTDPGPAEETERSYRDSVVHEAVLKLPEYQRAMIVMYHAEMLSYEEIAAALDLPIGTVKSRLNRARMSLRDVLSKERELFDAN